MIKKFGQMKVQNDDHFDQEFTKDQKRGETEKVKQENFELDNYIQRKLSTNVTTGKSDQI